jgi:acyl-CoA thioesterase-1
MMRVAFAAVVLSLTVGLSAGWANGPMKPIKDDPSLPRVLIIGDSISIGYTLPVRQQLAGEANVNRVLTNCASTARGVRQIDAWLGEGDWDVIVFNFGLHDLKYIRPDGQRTKPAQGQQQVSLFQYKKNLQWLVKRMRAKTDARLIFATTTPVPEGVRWRVPGDAKRYNQAAAKVMDRLDVAICDLFKFITHEAQKHQRPSNVHFTDEGSALLGARVTKDVRKALDDAVE